jgi:hypothetical protein
LFQLWSCSLRSAFAGKKGEAVKMITETLKDDVAKGNLALTHTKEEIRDLTQKVIEELRSGEMLSDVHVAVLTARFTFIPYSILVPIQFNQTEIKLWILLHYF